MIDNIYKSEQEESVTGHSGTTFTELLIQSLIIPVAFSLNHSLYHTIRSISLYNHTISYMYHQHHIYLEFLINYITLVLPIFLIFTVFSSDNGIPLLSTLLFINIGLFCVTQYTNKCHAHTHHHMISTLQHNDDNTNGEQSVSINDVQGGSYSHIDRHKKDDDIIVDNQPNATNATSSSSAPPFINTHINILTNYRFALMMCTCIAILAVDFPTLFPRRFCKTEVYGIGLMDVGVGSFVFANSLTSIPTKIMVSLQYHRHHHRHSVSYTTLKHLFSSVFPLLLLGVLRLLTIEATNYQSHVSEYGIHWNFFFTLAFVAFATVLLTPLLPINSIPTTTSSSSSSSVLSSFGNTLKQYIFLILGVLLILLYQYSLLHHNSNLTHYIFYAERTTLLSANKEGIYSSIGYLSIYLIGTQLGCYLIYHVNIVKQHEHGRRTLLIHLLILDGILWYTTIQSHLYIQPISRRLVNLTYLLFVFAYNLLIIATLLAIQLIQSMLSHFRDMKTDNDNNTSTVKISQRVTSTLPNGAIHDTPLSSSINKACTPSYSSSLFSGNYDNIPLLSHAVNYNSLAVFLLANLLTGLVNVSMYTLRANTITATIVMILYTLAISLIATVCYEKKWKIKIR